MTGCRTRVLSSFLRQAIKQRAIFFIVLSACYRYNFSEIFLNFGASTE